MKQILPLLLTGVLLASCATTKRVADKGRELDIVPTATQCNTSKIANSTARPTLSAQWTSVLPVVLC